MGTYIDLCKSNLYTLFFYIWKEVQFLIILECDTESPTINNVDFFVITKRNCYKVVGYIFGIIFI